MPIITVANQKGGVGKTTTVMNLGSAWAQMGHRVLVIDSDPQANLTSYLGATPKRTLDEIYLSKRVLDDAVLSEFIIKTSAGVDLIAADSNLTGVEYYLFSRSDKERVLTQFLAPLRSKYDYILIDTPPSLNLLTLNALCASTHVLIPVQPEFFGLEGIVKLCTALDQIRERSNPDLKLLGVLVTQVSQRRRLTQEVVQTLKQELGNKVFETMISENAAVTESSGHGVSVMKYARSSKGAKDYQAAATEVLHRMETHQ